jgi:hypothetical protein
VTVAAAVAPPAEVNSSAMLEPTNGVEVLPTSVTSAAGEPQVMVAFTVAVVLLGVENLSTSSAAAAVTLGAALTPAWSASTSTVPPVLRYAPHE